MRINLGTKAVAVILAGLLALPATSTFAHDNWRHRHNRHNDGNNNWQPPRFNSNNWNGNSNWRPPSRSSGHHNDLGKVLGGVAIGAGALLLLGALNNNQGGLNFNNGGQGGLNFNNRQDPTVLNRNDAIFAEQQGCGWEFRQDVSPQSWVCFQNGQPIFYKAQNSQYMRIR